MLNLIPLLIFASALYAQTSPVVDPNKFTICAITINSDEEKKIFQTQAAKHPKKFNPVVELTDMGDENDWFQMACQSKIRCDQLVISGHFAGEFFSEDPEQEKKLPLEAIERAGCSKSCEGILRDPYEVFLLGCNTLAGKEQDHRTPEEYLRVLLRDGFSADQAEIVVQSRYGSIGDSNVGSMQRAFAGASKNIYGFDSVGPSGKTIKPLLNNYFSKISLPEHLGKLQAKRMMNEVQSTNTVLADALKKTAFTQCNEGSAEDPVTKKICKFQDDRVSNTEKLDLMTEIFTQEDYLLYLPAMSRFLNKEAQYFSEKERKDLDVIAKNETIKNQIMGLISKTSSLGLKKEWLKLAMNLTYLSRAAASETMQEDIEKLFRKPLTISEKDVLCGGAFHEFDLNIQNKNIKSIGKLEATALACLKVKDQAVVDRLARIFESSSDLEQDVRMMLYFTEDAVERLTLTPKLMAKVKKDLKSSEDWNRSRAMSFLMKFSPKDKDLKPAVLKYLKENKDQDVSTLLYSIENHKYSDKDVLKEFLTLRESKNTRTRRMAIFTLSRSGLKEDWVQNAMLSEVTSSGGDYTVMYHVTEYFISTKPVKPEVLKALKSTTSNDSSIKDLIARTIEKLEAK